MAKVQTNFQVAHKAGFRKIDGLRAIAEIVAAHGNDSAFPGDKALEFLLHAGKLRASRKNSPPFHEGGLCLLERIEGIEKKRFCLAGNGLEVNPGVGNGELIAGPRDGDFDFAAFSSFSKSKLLVHKEQQFWRRAGNSGKIVALRGRPQSAGEKQKRRCQESEIVLHEMCLLNANTTGLELPLR